MMSGCTSSKRMTARRKDRIDDSHRPTRKERWGKEREMGNGSRRKRGGKEKKGDDGDHTKPGVGRNRTNTSLSFYRDQTSARCPVLVGVCPFPAVNTRLKQLPYTCPRTDSMDDLHCCQTTSSLIQPGLEHRVPAIPPLIPAQAARALVHPL